MPTNSTCLQQVSGPRIAPTADSAGSVCGATLVPGRVEAVGWQEGRASLRLRGGEWSSYDLVAVAAGVNSSILSGCEALAAGYARPRLTKTLIREYYLGEQTIAASLGTSMHVFLLDLPRLEFAAIIPKGDYVTMCLLGEGIDNALGDAFASTQEVQAVMPPGWQASERSCQCLPHINVRGVDKPYADRTVFIGDSGVTRLYKDGLGAAYRAAKAAATCNTALGGNRSRCSAPKPVSVISDSTTYSRFSGSSGFSMCRRLA